MNQPAPRFGWSLWFGLIALVFLLTLALLLTQLQSGRMKQQKIINAVADFHLTNQNSRAMSLADLRGHVWIADIIFTRCAGPCPRMTAKMRELQDALPTGTQSRLVTLTTDPDFDTPPILQKYAERFGADFNRWIFLTGAKGEIAALAIDSLKLSAFEVKPAERQNPADLFVHSTYIVILDKQARLRGVFETEGEGVDWLQIKEKILAAARELEREP